MGVTAIRELHNRSSSTVALFNAENPDPTTGHGGLVRPGGRMEADMWIPWASAADFPRKHLRLEVDGRPRYWIWQVLNADGDRVRFSTDGAYHDRGEPVDGIPAVDGDRTLVVLDDGFQLVHLPEDIVAMIRPRLGTDRYRLAGSSAERAVPSVPRSSASAFSVAGPASDARDCVYRDSGKRYQYDIEDGVVWATHPDGRREALRDAISYRNRRSGEPQRAPPFDLVAASGGRVIAKARDSDRFYFATMDDTFMHCTPGRAPFPVPSTYFKLDPESAQPDARAEDLTAHLEGWYANHPAAERFPFFRALLEQEIADLMMVRIRPRRWEELDPRPPVGVNLALALLWALADQVESLRGKLPREMRLWAAPLASIHSVLVHLAGNARVREAAPPRGLPSYPHVTYRADSGAEIEMRSIAYGRVLDVGVGHVHWHEQYEGVTGGEMQPMLRAEDYANAYRFVAGPVRDGDGYIDGTCTLYALVELGQPGGESEGYALLYKDEQTYFTGRWRLAGPDDPAGLLFAIVTDLDNPAYGFDRDAWWSPFDAGRVGPASRMAVAAQVVLVTGDADDPVARSRLYSTNFSWSTMDRTWRWRPLPASAEPRYFPAESGEAPIAEADVDTIYPQTIGLRDDMTLHLRGTRVATDGGAAETGRWYQRYLPASNRLAPADPVPGGEPEEHYEHAWKFLPEDVFRLADRFSHLGVYSTVDSRCQLYELRPATAEDERALEAGGEGPWVDAKYELYRWAPKLWWAAPLHILTPSNIVPGVLDRKPPSLFNRETRLRIARRGERWIAMHWDKRDDDLLPFRGLPGEELDVELTRGDRTARLTLTWHTWAQEPPAVRRAEFRWSGESGTPAAVALHPPEGMPGAESRLWRLRIAALVPGSPDAVVPLVDAELPGRLRRRGADAFELQWTPDGREAEALGRYATADGARTFGTSIWLEDLVGHVATPEEVVWLRQSPEPLPPEGVVIAGVAVDPAGRDVQPEEGEHVTILNGGAGAADVGGWYVEDLVGHRLRIGPGYEIPPGGELRVYTGPGSSTADRWYCGRRAAVLNNRGGDTVVLHTADGAAVSSYRWGPGGTAPSTPR